MDGRMKDDKYAIHRAVADKLAEGFLERKMNCVACREPHRWVDGKNACPEFWSHDDGMQNGDFCDDCGHEKGCHKVARVQSTHWEGCHETGEEKHRGCPPRPL